MDATCDQSSGLDANTEACARIEIYLDRIGIGNSDGLYDGSDAMQHDTNDINCPSSTSTATLTEIWLQLDFEPFNQYERMSSWARHAALVATVDAVLRDLLCQIRPRLTAGVRRGFSFGSNLQDVFPAIFCPGRSKAMSDRLRLVSSISQSIIKCRSKSTRLVLGYIESTFAEAPEEARCRQERHHHQEELENSLFMGLIHNTGNAKGAKVLKPLTATQARSKASLQSGEFSMITNDLELLHPPIQAADASFINLFLDDHNDSKRDSEVYQGARSPQAEPKCVDEVAVEVAARSQASPAFEDLTDAVSVGDPLPEDCELRGPLADRSRIESSFKPSPLSSFTDQQVILTLGDDVSMLREPFGLAEEAEARPSSDSSKGSDVIGEDDRLTQSWTRHSPRDDCSIRTTLLQVEAVPHASTTSDIQRLDKPNLALTDDLFGSDSYHSLETSLSAKPSFLIDGLEIFDSDSSVSSLSDLALDCLSQELQVPMNNSIDEDLTLAELLGDAKFSPEMWARRRSTVMHSIPSAHVANPPMRTIGSGWSLRSPSKETKGGPALPSTTHTQETRRPPVIEEDRRPIFFKRSSTSSSASASTPQSPAEINSHRRDSLLKRWSGSSKTSSDQEMLDLDLHQIDKRAGEVKRRKTIEDYDMRDAGHDGQEEDDMLIA